jgi:hypothetical protein
LPPSLFGHSTQLIAPPLGESFGIFIVAEFGDQPFVSRLDTASPNLRFLNRLMVNVLDSASCDNAATGVPAHQLH